MPALHDAGRSKPLLGDLRGYRASVVTLGAVEQPWDPVVESGDDLDGQGSGDRRPPSVADRVESLIPVVSRVVRARVQNPTAAEDLIQETLVRVLAQANRVDLSTLEAYAIVTARNVVTSQWTERDRQRRNQHRALDLTQADDPGDQLLRSADAEAVSAALANLSERERETLLAHEVAGRDTKSLAAEVGSSAGAIAAQLEPVPGATSGRLPGVDAWRGASHATLSPCSAGAVCR